MNTRTSSLLPGAQEPLLPHAPPPPHCVRQLRSNAPRTHSSAAASTDCVMIRLDGADDVGDFDTEWEAAEPTKSAAAAEGDKGTYNAPLNETLFLSPLIVTI